MPTHLYCLLPAGSNSAPPPPSDSSPNVGQSEAKGAEPGVAVRTLRIGGIVAWVASTADSRLTREGRRAAGEAVRHDQVVAQALARDVTPVPATLTDPYADDAALIADITSRTAEIVAAFDRARGAVEMAVILAPRDADAPDEPEGSGGPGRKYLERLRELPGRLAAAADEIDHRLAGVTRESTRRVDRDRIGLSHLIRREDVAAYRTVALACASDSYRMVVDGPRAPYSFAAFSPQTGVVD